MFKLRKDKQNQNNLLITFRLCIYIKSPIFSNSSHIQLLKLFNCFSVGFCNGTIQIEYGIENVNQLLFIKTDNLLFHSAKPAFPFFLFHCGPLSKIFIQLPREKKIFNICMRAQHFQMQRPLHFLITSCMIPAWLPNEH